MTDGIPGSRRGDPAARLRASVEATVVRERARVGFLIDGSGLVSVASGDPGDLEPASFVSLAFAQLSAAEDLAPVASGGDLSRLVQDGGRSRFVLASVHGGRTLALLYDGMQGGRRSTSFTGTQGPGSHPDVREVDQAARAIEEAPGPTGTLEEGWSREAESEIDRVFRGEV